MVFELAVDLAAVVRGSATRLLINDRADIAVAAGADGVQLTSTSLAVDVVREAFGAVMLIGVSTHSLEEVRQAEAGGADFAVFGPVFETPGKPHARGVDQLTNACTGVASFPVLAIGGIDAGNVSSVLSAGASGFAAIRALNDAARFGEIIRKVRNN